MENGEADFTRPPAAADVTLPGFRGRTTINPEDTEQRKTKGKERENETTNTDNLNL